MSGTVYGVYVIQSHYEGVQHGMWRDIKGTTGNKQKAINYLDKNHEQGIITTGSGKVVHIKFKSQKTTPTISYHKETVQLKT